MAYCGKNCGLIFVAGDYPIDRITKAITKQKYTSAGFYCSSSCTGKEKDLVILVDMLGVTNPGKGNPPFTMDSLINNPLVTDIAVMGLRDPRMSELFRMVVAEVTSTCIPPDVRATVHGIFGHHAPSSRKGKTGLSLVNEVIEKMGKKINRDERVSVSAINDLKLPKKLVPGAEAKYQLLDMLAFPFNNQSDQMSISSYLTPNEIFGDLREIELPERNPAVIERAKTEAFKKYRPSVDRLVSVIVDEMMTDDRFFQKVLDGVNFGLQNRAMGDEMYRNIIGDLLYKISAYDNAIASGSNIANAKAQLESQMNTVSSLFDLDSANVAVTYNPMPSNSGQLQDMVNKIATDVRLGNKARIDINDLISAVNEATGSNMRLIDGETTYPAQLLITNNK